MNTPKKKELRKIYARITNLRSQAQRTLEQTANAHTIDAVETDAHMTEIVLAKVLGVTAVTFRGKR